MMQVNKLPPGFQHPELAPCFVAVATTAIGRAFVAVWHYFRRPKSDSNADQLTKYLEIYSFQELIGVDEDVQLAFRGDRELGWCYNLRVWSCKVTGLFTAQGQWAHAHQETIVRP